MSEEIKKANVKMVKVRALRALTYRTGGKVIEKLGAREVETEERRFVKEGTTFDMPAEFVDELLQPFTGTFAFGGERIGIEAKQRHAIIRAELVTQPAA